MFHLSAGLATKPFFQIIFGLFCANPDFYLYFCIGSGVMGNDLIMTKTNKVKTKYPKDGNKPRLTDGAKMKAWDIECKRGRSWLYGLAFLLLWTFCSWTYGDVFYMTEQNSYFAFDGVIMKNITDMWDGWLIVTGRFLLLSFHYPCLGGLLMALLLTAVAWCLDCLFVRRAKWLPLVLVPSVAYLFVLASRGLNLYYKSEPGYVFVWPLLACIVLGVAVMVVRLFRKNSFNYIMLGKDCLRSCCVVALLIAILCSYVFVEQENTRATAKMERQMEQENCHGSWLQTTEPQRGLLLCCCPDADRPHNDQFV